MLQQDGPGGELEGKELEALVDQLRFSALQAQMVHVAIAELTGQLDLEGPFARGEGIGPGDGHGGAAVKAELQFLGATGPAPHRGPLQAGDPGRPAQSQQAELLQAGVGLGIEPQWATGQLPAVLGIEEGPQHQPGTERGQLNAGVAQKQKAAGGLHAAGLQVDPGSLGHQLGEQPAARTVEEVLQGESHLQRRAGRAGVQGPQGGPAGQATGVLKALQTTEIGAPPQALQLWLKRVGQGTGSDFRGRDLHCLLSGHQRAG